MGLDWKELVKPLADKIVYASQAYVSVKSSINDLGGSLIDFSRPAQGPADTQLVEVARFLRPWTAPDLELIRVGGDRDGGYVMSADMSVRRAISIGVGRDISWDVSMALMGVQVHAFDHTVRKLPQRAPGVTFHKVGVGTAPGCRPLGVLVAETAGDHDVILKIDIEGNEWEALAGEDLSQFTQILLELHDLERLMENSRIRDVLQHLHASHLPVHVHANNYGSLFQFDALWFCSAVEVTFVRRDQINGWHPADALREDLDRPCDPRTSDISVRGLLNLDPE